jgi:RNA polymerase sigma-B factor
VTEALDAAGFRHNASLDAPVSPSESNSLTASLGRYDERIDRVEGRLAITPLLARLDGRQRRILGLRFGHGLSQAEIAVTVGISQMQVSRILARTLSDLREWSEGAT